MLLRHSLITRGSLCAILSGVLCPGHSSIAIAQVCEPAEVTKLTDLNGASNDRFGYALDVDGDLAIVGAFGDDSRTGSAFIFGRDVGGADNWGLIKRIQADDAQQQAYFAVAVAISGDTAIVGATRDSTNGRFAGAAYIFGRDVGGTDNWGQVAKIFASDPQIGSRFGISVDIQVDRAVVGALGADDFVGAAYVFDRNEGGADNWGQANRLAADDGQATDYFGFDVSMDGDRILCTSYGSLDSDSGAAYLFTRNGASYDQTVKIVPGDPEPLAFFGYAGALSGSNIVIGCYGDDTMGADAGAVYVFGEDVGGPGNWGQVVKIFADDGAEGDNFGFDVTAQGDLAVVGAFLDNVALGSVYLFRQNEGGADNWGQIAHLTASDGSQADRFGRSVAISGLDLLVGTPQDDIGGPGNGAAYFFDLTPCNQSGIELLVDATCPDGGPISVRWTGATPNVTIALIFARGQGNFQIPNNFTCAGTILGLNANQIQIAFTGSSGQQGTRTVTSNTGPSACGGYLQLLDTSNCDTSNTAQIQ